ncbi:MAG: response regulator [Bacteroidia bacterium]|nr:response regulator [Bacteroidia bacterium]
MNKIETICIINDDDVYAFIIKKTIEKLSISNHVTTFVNGEDAINSFKNILNNLPDIILLDLNMPVMDGWNFLEAFETLQISYHIPIYLISAHISNEDNLKAKNNKLISAVLKDPTDTDTLLKITGNVLAK